jgi:isopropylmalate/homocitrate/citramalate synthase
LLGIASRFEVDAFLKAHDAYEPYSLEDIERDRATFRRLGF